MEFLMLNTEFIHINWSFNSARKWLYGACNRAIRVFWVILQVKPAAALPATTRRKTVPTYCSCSNIHRKYSSRQRSGDSRGQSKCTTSFLCFSGQSRVSRHHPANGCSVVLKDFVTIKEPFSIIGLTWSQKILRWTFSLTLTCRELTGPDSSVKHLLEPSQSHVLPYFTNA